ncbi:MAG: carbon-nitrogen hydrolase family protein [Bacteroidota bacterium]
MIIALAQINPQAGLVATNIKLHTSFIEEAAKLKANAVFFSELSLTSYEPQIAAELAFTLQDKRLQIFQALSEEYDLTIGLGIPLRKEQRVEIAMAIFQAGKDIQSYTKQFLHVDEEPFFESGNEQVYIHTGGIQLAPAICYESLLPMHAQVAVEGGSDIYLASVAKPENGYQKAAKYFPRLSKTYKMPVLMVNAIGPSDNFMAVGKTSAWSPQGELVGQLPSKQEGILLVEWQAAQAKLIATAHTFDK